MHLTARQWVRLAFLSALLCGLSAWASDSAFVPTDDNQVLEHVGHVTRPRPATRDLSAAVAYASQAIKQGNEEGDPRYFGYAQSALDPWWNLAQPPPTVRLLRATIRQWLHQFDAARTDLDALIAADGTGVMQAHLTRATLLLVQGDPAAARHDCVTLIGHVETLIAATCIASVNSRLGHLPAVQAALDVAIQQTPGPSPAALRWALTESADIAERRGQFDRAEAAYRRALDVMQGEGSRDPYLLAAYADFLLDRQRPADVVPLMAGLERIDNLLLRLTLAEAALGASDATWKAKAANHESELERRFAETRQRGDGVHQREEAMYLLKLRHRPAEALAVARDNWQHQRELIDARLLIQCAIADSQPAAATAVRDWAQRTGIEDVRL